MVAREIEENKEQKNKSVIFVCKYCGDLFFSFEERDKHRENCESKK